MAELDPAQAPSWTKFITDFDRTYKLFSDNVAGLTAIGPWVRSNQPQLIPEYNKLMAEAETHKRTLDQLAAVRNTVKGWLNSIGAVIGLGSLGAIPVAIGVTAAIGALTAITAWVTKIISFSQRTNEMKRLEGQGLTPQQAAAIVNAQSPMGSLFSNLKWILLLGAVVIVGPPLIRSLKGK